MAVICQWNNQYNFIIGVFIIGNDYCNIILEKGSMTKKREV